VARGELSTLRAGDGDFTAATTQCIVENDPDTSAVHTGDPPVSEAFWFLVRGADCGGGSYDSTGSAQAGPRTAEIDSAAVACL
jgi:hypothetical protein